MNGFFLRRARWGFEAGGRFLWVCSRRDGREVRRLVGWDGLDWGGVKAQGRGVGWIVYRICYVAALAREGVRIRTEKGSMGLDGGMG